MREMIRTHVYCHDWDQVTSAFWLKYPNESQPHVQEIHTVERDIDHDNGVVQLKRLVCIDYALPGWIERLINFRLKGHAMENINIDLKNRKLTLKGQNLTFWNIFKVEEECIYEAHPENSDHTLFTQTQRYTVSGFETFNGILENYCINKGKDAGGKGLKVMYGRISALEDEWDCRIDKWKGECKEIIQNGKCQLAKVEDKLRELEHDFDQKVDEVKDTITRSEEFQKLVSRRRLLEKRLHEIAHKPVVALVKQEVSSIGAKDILATCSSSSKEPGNVRNKMFTSILQTRFGQSFSNYHILNPFTHSN